MLAPQLGTWCWPGRSAAKRPLVSVCSAVGVCALKQVLFGLGAGLSSVWHRGGAGWGSAASVAG